MNVCLFFGGEGLENVNTIGHSLQVLRKRGDVPFWVKGLLKLEFSYE